jgi:ankyrin repeat protein
MIEDVLDEEKELIKDPETIEKMSQKIFQVLQTKDETNIISELYKKEYSNIDLTLCINSSHNNNTILTTLANYNLPRATINYISIIKSYKKPSEQFLAYINQKNSKGYNALLYSAFRGNLEIFNKLMENGADISSTNSSGLNALHLAAQGNFPNIIIFLIEKYGFDINSKDNKGNTALHWAVYSDCRQTVDYLIYYNIDINLKDNDDDTALQIAMRKNYTYLVKKLREDYGTFFNKKENEVKIKQNENENNNEVPKNKNNSLFASLFKQFSGKNTKGISSFQFLLIIIFIELFNQIIILRGYNNFFMSFVFFILFAMLLFFYFASSKSDAGELTTKCINSLLILAEQGEDMKNICPWCINYLSEKTKHCFLCKKCIKYQEFHDNYINNCVGKNNFSLYISFLYFFVINFSFKLIISFWGLFWIKGTNFKNVVGFIIPQIVAVSIFIVFGVLKIRAKTKIFNDLYFGNFIIRDIKDPSDNNISTSNSSVKKNFKSQIPSFGENV